MSDGLSRRELRRLNEYYFQRYGGLPKRPTFWDKPWLVIPAFAIPAILIYLLTKL